MSSQGTRRVIWTGAIAAVTAAGAIFGAQLKDDQEAVQVCQQRSFTCYIANFECLEVPSAQANVDRGADSDY